MMSVMLSAAGSLRWFRDALAPGVAFGELVGAGGATCRPGSDGLVFLPYLTGERSPHPDPLARGAFVGLTRRPRPTPPDARGPRGRRVRAPRRARPDDRRGHAGTRRQIRASGGGIASALWRQILADVLGAEIATVNTTEGAAYGAALLAAVGAGWYPTVEAAAAALVRATPVAAPGPDAARYADALRGLSRPLSRARPDVPSEPDRAERSRRVS